MFLPAHIWKYALSCGGHFLLQSGLAMLGLASFHAVASAKSVTEIILFFVCRYLLLKDTSCCIVVENIVWDYKNRKKCWNCVISLMLESCLMKFRHVNLITVSNLQCSVSFSLPQSLLHLHHELGPPFLLLPFPIHEISPEPSIQDVDCNKHNNHDADNLKYAEPRFWWAVTFRVWLVWDV